MVIILLVLSFFLVRPFLEAIIVGALLAYITFPIYKIIHKKLPESVSALLICFMVLLIIVIPAVFLVKFVVQDAYATFTLVKDKLSEGIFTNCASQLCKSIETFVQTPQINAVIQDFMGSFTANVFERGSRFLISLPRIIINLFVMLFALFYFLKGGELFLSKLGHYLNIHKKAYSHILTRLKEIVYGIVFGYLIIALIQGALGALGFFIFGVSSPIFWGMVMALLALIPVLGTGFVWVPAAIFLFLEGTAQNSNVLIFKGIALFLYGLLIVSTVDNILKPKLIGNKAKVHPLIILVGIFGGLYLIGPLGVIIGPLALSFTAVVVDTYLNSHPSY